MDLYGQGILYEQQFQGLGKVWSGSWLADFCGPGPGKGLGRKGSDGAGFGVFPKLEVPLKGLAKKGYIEGSI